MTVYLETVRRADGQVVTREGPMPEYRADRRTVVLSIDLDHSEFYLRIVDEAGRDIDAAEAA